MIRHSPDRVSFQHGFRRLLARHHARVSAHEIGLCERRLLLAHQQVSHLGSRPIGSNEEVRGVLRTVGEFQFDPAIRTLRRRLEAVEHGVEADIDISAKVLAQALSRHAHGGAVGCFEEEVARVSVVEPDALVRRYDAVGWVAEGLVDIVPKVCGQGGFDGFEAPVDKEADRSLI